MLGTTAGEENKEDCDAKNWSSALCKLGKFTCNETRYQLHCYGGSTNFRLGLRYGKSMGRRMHEKVLMLLGLSIYYFLVYHGYMYT